MLLYPYIEMFRRIRKGQELSIETIVTLIMLFAGILVFVAVLYYLMSKGQGEIDAINPLIYQ